jgi:oligopeptide/dipeptide ABC transporter ATP-binding protein
MSGPLLEVRGLRTHFATRAGVLPAVDGIDLSIDRGRILGLVGESGSGKTVTGFSILGLVDPPGRIVGGSVRFDGQELVGLDQEGLRRLRGRRIAMVFQDPMMTLNPVLSVGEQMALALRAHQDASRAEARARSRDLLGLVGIPSPEERLSAYPHQLSGGMRQRIVIAMALACEPSVVIADEPTTALDVTVQAQILELMQGLQRELGMAIILITHDLGVIAETCNDVVVMYAGRIAEAGPVQDIFSRPSHPYTRGLLDSIPTLDKPRKTRLNVIEGMVPGLKDLPAGCRFQNRCPYRIDLCATQPPLEEVSSGHETACHRWRELLRR